FSLCLYQTLPPPRSTLFPYTTLFRSIRDADDRTVLGNDDLDALRLELVLDLIKHVFANGLRFAGVRDLLAEVIGLSFEVLLSLHQLDCEHDNDQDEDKQHSGHHVSERRPVIGLLRPVSGGPPCACKRHSCSPPRARLRRPQGISRSGAC